MSIEAQLRTHYNEETSGSSHSNLDPAKVIMQELELMRKDMKEIRRNITNLSMEHRDQRNIVGHVNSHTQWEIWTKFGVENYEGQRQGQPKVKFIESSMVEKSTRIKELPHDKIEESLKIHVVEEPSKEEPFCIMNEKSIEIKEKERVEEKERLVERSCNFDSISIISKESENFECSKEKESELEKSERVKENEYFIEKQESEKEKILKIQARMKQESLHTRVEDKGRNMEKELGNFLEDLPISLSLNPFLIWHEVSFVELELFLESYLSHLTFHRIKEAPVKSQSLQAKDLVDEGKMEKKRPSHSKIKSLETLKTLKALSMLEWK
ncbi:hypothetical protein M9H77_03270 [Catharanthus roseus]|uniref:Uncharacterized protein n=1 Tax=Catharanthus roseus TaxID=4058 RepID=A0ACC0CAS3_CATRO|nr:hypothetical protein M9H77_03270 [Catharanthus roseus]